jgi:hypothetical protein
LAAASAILVTALAAAFGAWRGTGALAWPDIAVAGRYALQTLGYLMLALFVATAIRRTGAAVLAFIAYTLLAEPLLRGLLLPHVVSRDLPSAALASLVPNPFFGYAGMRVTGSTLHAVAVSTAFVLAFAAASQWIFSRQDL